MNNEVAEMGSVMNWLDKSIALFVLEVAAYPDGAPRSKLKPADRGEDKVRQAARKRGLVTFENRGNGYRWFVCKATLPT